MLLLSLALVMIGGCAPPKLAVTVAKAKPPLPALPQGKVSSVMEGINGFTFRLIGATEPTNDKNVLISPFSVSAALSMLIPGTAPGDQKRLLAVLDPGLTAEQAMTGNRDLVRTIASSKGQPLQIANSAWLYRKMPFNPAYAKELADVFNSEIRSFDPNASSVQEINGWVDEKTKHRIPEIIGSIKDDERLILINAIAFDGTWVSQFDPQRTRQQPFHRLNGGDVNIPTMHATQDAAYLKNDELRAVRLDYEGDEFAMLLMLPEQGKDAGAMLRGLDPSKLRAILAGMSRADDLPISLPRFKFKDQYEMTTPLSALGLGSLFKMADFSPVSPALAQGAVSRVIHKTFIDVDEKGTKAAAATGVVMKATAIRVDRPEFIADRPFAFLILHKPSNAVVFVGVVNDPSLAG